jgi:hypothetical protein
MQRWIFILCLLGPWAWGESALGQVPQVGDVAADFTLEQLGGGSVSLSDFRGKAVYINFFGYS